MATGRRAGLLAVAVAAAMAVLAGCGLAPSDGIRTGDGSSGVERRGFLVSSGPLPPEQPLWVGLDTLCALDDETRLVDVEPTVAAGAGTVDYFLRDVRWDDEMGVGATYEEPDRLVPVAGAQVSTRCGPDTGEQTQLVARVTRDGAESLAVTVHRVGFVGAGGRRHLDTLPVLFHCGTESPVVLDDDETEYCVHDRPL